MIHRWKLFFWGGAGILLSGCAVITPFVQEFNIVPVSQEIEIGERMHEQIASQMPLLTGTSMNQTLETISNRLVEVLPNQVFDYRFYVVRDPTPNAFAIPGGRIYVHSGLFDFVDSEDMLAGVLAHEIGHVYERHPAKAISRAYGLNRLSNILLDQSQGAIQNMALQFLEGAVLSRYSREDEREADKIAFYLLRRTRYDTGGLLRFLRKLQAESSPGSVPEFLRTHPTTQERIELLQSLQNQQVTAGAPVR